MYAVWMEVLASALASPVLMAMLSGFATTTATTSSPGAATWLTMLIVLLQAASRKLAARLVRSGLVLLVGPHGLFGASSSIRTDTTLLLAEVTASLLIGYIMVAWITTMSVVLRHPVKAGIQDSELNNRRL